jgi:hypothetical protein
MNNNQSNYVTVKSPDIFEHITLFETIQILQFRSKQIDSGARTTLSDDILNKYLYNINDKNSYKIASLEMDLRKIPLKLKRLLPDGTYQLININKSKIIKK